MRLLRAAVALGLAASLLSVGSQVAQAIPPPPTVVVYDSIPAVLPGNVPSMGFQATQTNEIGDLVRLAPGPRVASSFSVVMSSWACETGSGDTCVTTPGSTFSHDITLTLYAVDHTGPTPEPGAPLLTDTETFAIPFRPTADLVNCLGDTTFWPWWDGSTCFNGFANLISFDISGSNTVLPSEVIWGIAFNTQSWGAVPIGVDGPYNSLNVGVETFVGEPSEGTDTDPEGLVWNTETAGWYCDGGAGGSGTFRTDTGPGCWTGYTPLAHIETVEASLVSGTVVVDPSFADGWTFDQTGGAAEEFVTGPDTPPLGEGSLEETVGSNGDDFVGARNGDWRWWPVDLVPLRIAGTGSRNWA